MSNMEEHLTLIKNEIAGIENKLGWNTVYQTIRSESCKYDYPCVEARAPENKLLNRYRDVSPFDHSRVMIKNGPCSYINASFVKVERAGRNYILTQGPLPHTASHFWLMVWEQKSRAVLMLNKIIEKNQIKCHQYWPIGSRNDDSDIMEFLDVGLRIRLLTEEETQHYVIRTLRIEETSSGSCREVLQFHYTTWPDFGVPSTARAFLHFLQAVRDSGALNSNVGPPVVHCSAGIGRSGTFCLVDSCLLMMEQDITVNVKDILLDMRRYRMGLIQTADQLRFSYLAILEGIQQLVQGQTKFMPDEGSDAPRIEEPVPPRPPPRIESREKPTNADFRRIIENGSMGINRPLPDTPSDDDDSSYVDSLINDDDDSDSDSDSDSDNLREEEKLECTSYPKPVPEAVEEIADLKSKETESNGGTDEILNNSHHKTNGVDSTVEDPALRRRMKNDALREKIRDIKQHQREAETVQHYYRSFTGPKALTIFVCSALALVGYMYFKH